MTIKELEALVGMTRANIRFYELGVGDCHLDENGRWLPPRQPGNVIVLFDYPEDDFSAERV